MKASINFIYILIFLVCLVGVGLFYFNYYGLHIEINNEEISAEISKELPKKIETAYGDLFVEEVKEIQIFPGNKFDVILDSHLIVLHKYKIHIRIYLSGEIIFYQRSNFLGIKKIEITQIEIDESAILSNTAIKSISRKIQKKLPVGLFYESDFEFVSEFSKQYIESFETDYNKLKIHFKLFRTKHRYFQKRTGH